MILEMKDVQMGCKLAITDEFLEWASSNSEGELFCSQKRFGDSIVIVVNGVMQTLIELQDDNGNEVIAIMVPFLIMLGMREAYIELEAREVNDNAT